jgi:hypothetical protein
VPAAAIITDATEQVALDSGKNALIKSQKTQPLNERSLQISAYSQRNTAHDWPRAQDHVAKPPALV